MPLKVQYPKAEIVDFLIQITLSGDQKHFSPVRADPQMPGHIDQRLDIPARPRWFGKRQPAVLTAFCVNELNFPKARPGDEAAAEGLAVFQRFGRLAKQPGLPAGQSALQSFVSINMPDIDEIRRG